MNKQSIISAFTTTNEAGEVVGFNFAEFDSLVSDLVSERATLRKTNKEAIKAQREAQNEAQAVEGKRYYDSLPEGAVFFYRTADGTLVTARKIKTKSGSGNSAACEVIDGLKIEAGKTTRRYPKFHTIVLDKVVDTEQSAE